MTWLGDCSQPLAASVCLYSFRRCAMSCDVCHGPDPALHVSLLLGAKQAIVASKTANISLICHQCTNTICAPEVPQVFKTRIDAICAASWDGNHRYRRQGEKKKGDGHYRLKCLGKTSDGNNCDACKLARKHSNICNPLAEADQCIKGGWGHGTSWGASHC